MIRRELPWLLLFVVLILVAVLYFDGMSLFGRVSILIAMAGSLVNAIDLREQRLAAKLTQSAKELSR